MNPDRSAESPVAPEIADQAVKWLVELQAGAINESVRQAWKRWREEDPEHERAWQHIESVNQRLKGLGPLSVAVLGDMKRNGRRRSLKLLVLIAAGGAAGWAAKDAGFVREWAADHSTRVGERLTVELADGGSVVLNTDSALDVQFDGARRVLRLIRGEIMVTTAADKMPVPRPFLVETRHGSVRAIGTRFAVRLNDDGSAISVFEGAVDLRPIDRSQSTLILAAGQQAVLTRNGVRGPSVLDESAGAWTRGMIVALNMPLGQFLAELSRHRSGLLGCAPEIAQLRVSGTYPLDDTDRILAAIERVLPVKVQRFTRYWVSVLPLGAG